MQHDYTVTVDKETFNAMVGLLEQYHKSYGVSDAEALRLLKETARIEENLNLLVVNDELRDFIATMKQLLGEQIPPKLHKKIAALVDSFGVDGGD